MLNVGVGKYTIHGSYGIYIPMKAKQQRIFSKTSEAERLSVSMEVDQILEVSRRVGRVSPEEGLIS